MVAAPLAQVAASVETLPSKPALAALGDDATVARVDRDAATPEALAPALRDLLGAVVDAVGPEGIRAVTSLDGVTDLASARAAAGTYLVAPAAFSFAQVAAVFGPPADGDGDGATTIKDADDLSAKLTSAFQAREDPAAIEKRLRASRGVSEWGAVFGVAPRRSPRATRARPPSTRRSCARRCARRSARTRTPPSPRPTTHHAPEEREAARAGGGAARAAATSRRRTKRRSLQRRPKGASGSRSGWFHSGGYEAAAVGVAAAGDS